MALRVGQKVVCVDDRFSNEWRSGWRLPVAGCVYTIRAFSFGATTQQPSQEGILLAELDNSSFARRLGDNEPIFGKLRFRPVAERKTDISIFTAMLNQSRENVRG